ncbi:hypothetical protein A1O1_03930 [Capronia coronata CBS 617.96]|uniref:Peroxisomal membrane protein PEX14 n=1 Tax=Capronia coronata CBS 617.96 TaxID=1182541 RepID=W9YMB5_9EURO|nr:uncharacterized protein A1O1_03930 [Capronia coronata CBS 617.96]EXJ90825.1 hypothetical protein A1O1_03930 [Capronia coronata CBS 617.96]
MADQDSKKVPSIPEWQKFYQPAQEGSTAPDGQPSSGQKPLQSNSTTTEPSPLEQARRFLEDDSIRDASREQKAAFLQHKGVHADDINTLLGPEQPSSSSPSSELPSELKTVHDNSEGLNGGDSDGPAHHIATSATTETSRPAETAPKRDIPPIITYPEFLLKPQKPPPLVTFERLANAAYVFAGISALTYGASKYIVAPMLETLTEARHELAETARADLETLNKKLESTVSHVPYFASSTVSQKNKYQDYDEDVESVDSDPTELFHRDIATQTSPARSRSASRSSLQEAPAQDPTVTQSARLTSLHGTLSSLLTSTTTHFSHDRLKDQMSQLQGMLVKMETSYNPFQIDYGSSFPGHSVADDKNKLKKPASDSEASKFKAEIRSFKGALLSSRNFPTARPAGPYNLSTR